MPREAVDLNDEGSNGNTDRCDSSGSRKTTPAEVDDVQQRPDGGGNSTKSSDGGGGGGGNGGGGGGGGGSGGGETIEDDRRVCPVRRVLYTAVKAIVVATLLTAISAFIWYTMGLPFLLQIAAVVLIAYIASGGYKFIYLVYRTAPRDIR